MVTPTHLLNILPNYKHEKILISKNQTFSEISDLMLFGHVFFSGDYEKICNFFKRKSLVESAQFIFSFLKKNIRYREEREDDQRVANPAGILFEGVTFGVDCKSFALFSAGVLAALLKKDFFNSEKKVTLGFKFVGREKNSMRKSHVFTFMRVGDIEYWIDPVPGVSFFNERPSFDLFLKKEMILKNSNNGVVSGQWN